MYTGWILFFNVCSFVFHLNTASCLFSFSSELPFSEIWLISLSISDDVRHNLKVPLTFCPSSSVTGTWKEERKGCWNYRPHSGKWQREWWGWWNRNRRPRLHWQTGVKHTKVKHTYMSRHVSSCSRTSSYRSPFVNYHFAKITKSIFLVTALLVGVTFSRRATTNSFKRVKPF